MRTALLVVLVVLSSACAGVSAVGVNMDKNEVTLAGRRWAGEGAFRDEAAQFCKAGASPVLARAGAAAPECHGYVNCAVYSCR